MQFQVPQFIEVEDKIFGPLTFKQFIYLAGGAGCAYLFWRSMPLFLSAPLILSSFGLSAALAFFEWNGRPFVLAIEHAFFYLVHPKLYLWNNRVKKMPAQAVDLPAEKNAGPYVPRLSDSKLHELAWSLDIRERIHEGMDERANVPYDRMAAVRSARSDRDAIFAEGYGPDALGDTK